MGRFSAPSSAHPHRREMHNASRADTHCDDEPRAYRIARVGEGLAGCGGVHHCVCWCKPITQRLGLCRGVWREVRYVGDMPADDLITAVEIMEPVQFNRVSTREATKDQLLAVPWKQIFAWVRGR